MMKFIEFDKEKCDSCYKCLRICPTKAISFNKSERKIIDSLCIKCGLCQASCPQEALKITSQVDYVQSMIDAKETVVVSIAPSFVGAFGLSQPGKMVTALKKVGFSHVEETAFGAEIIANHYDACIEKNTQKNYITSCCPSANYLIEEYYPMLIPYVIPVVSPMIAHGRSIKKRYGANVKTVFIGPCLAKMAEAEELPDAIDAVVTFEELELVFKSEHIILSECEVDTFDAVGSQRGRAFPLGGSLRNPKNERREDHELRFIHVDGIDNCKEVLNELRLGNIEHCCIEMNICDGSCINGPDMPKNYLGRFQKEIYMREYAKQKDDAWFVENNTMRNNIHIDEPLDIKRSFTDLQKNQQEPNSLIVREIMRKMGKYTSKDELNCGACGYKACYDKAKAVYFGYSDIETCLPYLREKAESLQNVMIENSPNGVLVIDNNLTIREVNPSFNQLFNQEQLPVKDMPIQLFLNDQVFIDNIKENLYIKNKKIYFEETNRYFIINMVCLEETNQRIIFLTDITGDEKRRKEFHEAKEKTLSKTQEVIDKQMRVAQEIASLLGETTAETKMSLKSLNQLFLDDGGVF